MDEEEFNCLFAKGFKNLTPEKYKELFIYCKERGLLIPKPKHFETTKSLKRLKN